MSLQTSPASSNNRSPERARQDRAKGAPLPFLGLACAVGVSSIYFNQPLLSEMAKTFHSRPEHIGFVAVATQVGYAAGLLTFVPMGDVMERRALMMRMYAAVSVALLLVAVAPSLLWVIFASVLVGTFASVTHIVLPLAPDLVDDRQRGRAIGIVMTGLLMGVLLARTFSGWVSKIHGWRWVFVAAAIFNAAFVPLLWRKMPRLPAKEKLHYADAMASLWTLYRTQPLLREASIVGGLMFASFSCFWTTLAFLLDTHYQLGPGAAGSFGIVGAAGALIASVAGRWADRHGARWVASMGLATLTFSYLILWAAVTVSMSTVMHVAALVLGVVILDIGAQMTQIANQTRIFGLVPSARSRLNTVYMVLYFAGAALGSWLSTLAWSRWGWNGVCTLALCFMALAALRHITGIRNPATAQAPAAEAATTFLEA
jgi:predicted MFS family arabinose efflux permease